MSILHSITFNNYDYSSLLTNKFIYECEFELSDGKDHCLMKYCIAIDIGA